MQTTGPHSHMWQIRHQHPAPCMTAQAWTPQLTPPAPSAMKMLMLIVRLKPVRFNVRVQVMPSQTAAGAGIQV